MKLHRHLCVLLFALVASSALAEMQPFNTVSMAEIRKQYEGQPFILALWSVSCHFCVEDLGRWRRLQSRHPKLPIVLVNTDAPEEQSAAQKLLTAARPGKARTLAFADAYTEPLRWSVDPAWHGELPRTYFFNAAHRVEAMSGRVSSKWIEAWITKQARKSKIDVSVR